MKSYTNIEQSKILVKILPLDSADMYYFLDPTPAGNIYHLVVQQIGFGVKTREPEYDRGDIPCWSLAALLGVLTENKICHYDDRYYCQYISKGGEFPFYSTAEYDNPVDACYNMIIELHELNLL